VEYDPNRQSERCLALDLGRCDLDDGCLIHFKENWGAKRSALGISDTLLHPAFKMHCISSPKSVRTIVSYTPRIMLKFAGIILYTHMG
jgi:hypothetical protein